jgi:hemerythrin-like domain-containing protein
MDAIALIRQDHRVAEELFRRYEGLTDPAGRRETVEAIIRELSIHAAIEEQVLYPAVQDVLEDGESLAREALDEHRDAKEALSDLDRMDPTEPGFDGKVRAMIAEVRHHVEEEETEMLPKLASALPASRLEEIGESLERARTIAPTRPHPHAPQTPPGNVVAGAVAAVVDRIRDAATRRPERVEAARSTSRKATTRKTAAGKATTTRRAAASTAKRSSTERTTKSRARKAATAKKSTVRKAATAKKSTVRKAATAKRAAARKSTNKRTTAARRSTARPAAGPVIHVTSDDRGGWRAEQEGSSRAVARGESKSDVVRRAREVARSKRGRLVVHKQNGRIQEQRSYA